MSSFRSRNRPFPGLLLACALALPALPVLPATGQEPQTPPAQTPAPAQPGEPASLEAREPEQEEPDRKTLKSRLGSQGGDIEMSELGGAGAIGLGTLTGEDSLPRDVWADTHIDVLRSLLPRLPVGAPSPAMNDLARRLLLSSVAAPEGPDAAEAFAYLRLERLYAAGRVEDAVSFGTLAAEAHEVEGILSLLARAQMLQGEDEAACRTASRMRLQSEDPFWTRVRAFCYVQDNAAPAAILTANLLEEQDKAPELYLKLIRRLANDTADEVPADAFQDHLSALEMAMLRQSGLLPPPAVVENSNLAVIRTVASISLNRPTAELVTMRLAAAEEAARRGALEIAELERIYGSVPFEPQVRSGAVRYARENGGPWANALLYQVARAQSAAAVSAEYLTIAFETTRGTPAYLMLAQVYRDLLTSIPRTLDLAPRGYELGLASLAAGAAEQAREWRGVLKSSAIAEATAGAGQVGTARASQTRTLGALLRIAQDSPSLSWQPTLADGWTKAAEKGLVPELQVARELMMLRALGHELTPGANAWLRSAQAQASGYMADPEVLRALEGAAARGHLGETALLALIAVGPGGPQETHPVALAKAVRALKSVGLEKIARRLALESVLAVIPS
ncbi:MAG: hypothetical protein ACLFWF_10850 [Alphaproteobacteria bacterium]